LSAKVYLVTCASLVAGIISLARKNGLQICLRVKASGHNNTK